MTNEIYISNSKLKLVKDESFDSEACPLFAPSYSGPAKDLRFRKAFLIIDSRKVSSPTEGYLKPYTFGEKATIHKYESCWYLCNSSRNSKITYDVREKEVLMRVLQGLLTEDFNIEVVEFLINALDDERIAEGYITSVDNNRNTIKLINNIIDGSAADYEPLSHPVKSVGDGYTVFELLQDLEKDGAYIYTNPELLGKYTKMSRGKKYDSKTDVCVISDVWSKILKVSGNSRRSNLNILYSGKVMVDVPKNDVGVAEGPVELDCLRSICIVRDGNIWTNKIGVRINSKELIRKVQSSKAVVCNLVYANEFLLDLSVLPVIKKELIKVDSFNLARYEAEIKMCSVVLGYYRRLLYKQEHGLSKLSKTDKITDRTKTEKEEFLNSLGIYGNTFYPVSKNDYEEYSYSARIFEANVEGLPKNNYQLTQCYIEFINTGSCSSRSALVNDVLKSTDITSKPLKELIEDVEMRRMKLQDKLSLLKFRLLMNRSARFREHKSPKLTDKRSVKYCVYNDRGVNLHYLTVSWYLGNEEIHV